MRRVPVSDAQSGTLFDDRCFGAGRKQGNDKRAGIDDGLNAVAGEQALHSAGAMEVFKVVKIAGADSVHQREDVVGGPREMQAQVGAQMLGDDFEIGVL